MKNIIIIGGIVLVVLIAIGAFFLDFGSQKTVEEHQIAEQTQETGGITVRARSIISLAEFEIIMDTHTGVLDHDMVSSAFLVDMYGREYPALAWEGDPPGGHHRTGTLKFDVSKASSAGWQLVIRNIGSEALTFNF